jgi:L-ribulose-5-phosphate 3-epimerase
VKICVRAHDLEVKGTEQIIKGLHDAGADGAQLVCFKSFEDVEKSPGGITERKAKEIGNAFKKADLFIELIGAYFNPVHSDEKKVRSGIGIFCDYLEMSGSLGCNVVGSETGSYNDEPWVYHPKNRTEEALERVAEVFQKLCDFAAKHDAVVGIEGASGHVCYDVVALDKATRLIERENLKVIFDLYNYLDSKNFRNYIDILAKGLAAFAGRIHCFHIKDCIFADGGLKQCAVGKGDLDFNRIIPIIKRYDENAVLILEGTKTGDIKKSIGFIRETWQAA